MATSTFALIIIGVLILIFLGIVFLAIVFITVSMYNNLVNQKQQVHQHWSNVESVLQRRMDLIPSLVETVKGYAKHEKETLSDVIRYRSESYKPTISNPDQLKAFMKNQNDFSAALSKLMVVTEKYPDLKADKNFMRLQEELSQIEYLINQDRNQFNQATQSYNSTVLSFFGGIVNKFFLHYQELPYFEAKKEAHDAPRFTF